MGSTGKVLGIGAAACALGYGGYYYTQASEVSKYEQEEKTAQKLVDSEKKKLKEVTKALTESETRKTMLAQQYEDGVKALKATEGPLEAARKRVQQLEKEYNAKQETVSKVSKDLDSVTTKVLSLKRDAERTSEAATMGEKSLKIAQMQATEARRLYNPLNHPKVLALVGGRTK